MYPWFSFWGTAYHYLDSAHKHAVTHVGGATSTYQKYWYDANGNMTTPVSLDGSDTSVIRITNVQADRFTLYVDEAPDRNVSHTTEAVSYLVLEAGNWQLPDGTLLEVGKLNTSKTVGKQVTNQWAHVNLDLPFSAAPAVVSQVQTNNDSHWVKTRQQNAAASGFDVALEEDDNQTAAHGSETIGWMAIEAGSGDWSGHNYRAANTSNAVTHALYTISFGSGTFTQAPRFIGGLATYDGSDGSYARYSRTSLTASSVQVMVEEDTTYDSETNHTTEVVSYLAIQGNGTLAGQAITKYYYAAGQRVAMNRNGVVQYLHADHLGSTTLATDASGTEVTGSRTLYYPYGEERWSASGGTLATDYGFTGQRREGFGLMDYNARFYDPYLARFISADTIVPSPGDPQSLNRYSYTGNNPIKYVDPSGHFIILPALALIAVVAGGGAIVDWSFQVSDNMYNQGMSFWDAAYHENLNEGEMVQAAAVAGGTTAAVVTAGPALVTAAGQGLMGAGMATGSTTLWTAGSSTAAAGTAAYAALWNVEESLESISGPTQDSDGRWRNPNGTFARNPNATPKVSTGGVHGNSLDSPRSTTLYRLVDRDTGQVMKYGITSESNPANRYGARWLDEQNVDLEPMAIGARRYIYELENKLVTTCRPPWNLNDH